MNIIVISGLYSLQPKSGGSLVMKLYVEELRRQGHHVTLLYDTSEDADQKAIAQEADNYYLPAINNTESAKRSFSTKLQTKLGQWKVLQRQKFLPETESKVCQYLYKDFNYLKAWLEHYSRENKIDMIQVDFPWLMNLSSYLPTNIKKVFVSHEMQAVRLEREAEQAKNQSQKQLLLEKSGYFRKHEIVLGSKFDAIFTLTDAEQKIWKSYLPDSTVALSPLGINIPKANNAPGKEAEKLVFVANAKHLPNIDALRFFLAEIWPLIESKNKNLRFYITGEYDAAIKNSMPVSDRIIWSGFVDDLPQFMHNAVSIVPVRIGSGIRVKILESMSMGVPVVSTKIGAEGIMAKDGESILLADAPAEFASKVLALFYDAALYRRIAKEGHQLVADNYNLHDAVRRRIDLFKGINKR